MKTLQNIQINDKGDGTVEIVETQQRSRVVDHVQLDYYIQGLEKKDKALKQQISDIKDMRSDLAIKITQAKDLLSKIKPPDPPLAEKAISEDTVLTPDQQADPSPV